MIKKIVSIIIFFALCWMCCVSSYAADLSNYQCSVTAKDGTNISMKNAKEIKLEQSDFAGLSGVDLGKAKLEYCGHSEGFINSIPSSTLEKIASSEVVYQTVRYMKEEVVNGEVELVEATAEEFEKKKCETQNAVLKNSVMSHEAYNNASVTVDNGMLMTVSNLINIPDSVIQPHLLFVTEFQWTSMPKYRGTDFFGITKDVYTTVIPNTFSNYYSYLTDRYLCTASATNVSVTYMDTTPTTISNLQNENATSPNEGFAYRFSVPTDFIPSLISGASAYEYIRHSLTGGCCFEFSVAQPSITSSFNLWTTYLHQKSLLWCGSPSISIPIGASITVDPQASYSDPVVEEHIILRQ